MYSIEWQKRGLPHAHILIWLVEKIGPDQIDDIINAEIVDPEIDADLHDVVVMNMIHGPCGAINPPITVHGRRQVFQTLSTKIYDRDHHWH